MLPPDASIAWWMPLLATGVIALVAFLVSFLETDVLRLPRPTYLASLMVVTGALVSGYLAWSGTDAAAFLTGHWGWGLLGALASGALTVRMVMAGASRRGIPTPAGRRSAHLAGTLVWEGSAMGSPRACCCRPCPYWPPGSPSSCWAGPARRRVRSARAC